MDGRRTALGYSAMTPSLAGCTRSLSIEASLFVIFDIAFFTDFRPTIQPTGFQFWPLPTA